MYPGTIFNWHDNSQFTVKAPKSELDNPPLILAAFSADKGPENLVRVKTVDEFIKLYGSNLSFEKHGQPLLEAYNIASSGAELLAKRVVAPDATLSNAVLIATVTKQERQEKDQDGRPLYINNATGEPTTDAKTDEKDNVPYTKTFVSIEWSKQSVGSAKTFDEVVDFVNAGVAHLKAGEFPIMAITDIGRNADIKSVRIVPDYSNSKTFGTSIYKMSVLEGTNIIETKNITGNQQVLIDGKSYAATEHTFDTISVKIFEDKIQAMHDYIATALNGKMAAEDFEDLDMFFARTCTGEEITNVALSSNSLDMSATLGFKLEKGSNGTEFGDTAFYKSDAYDDAMISFFTAEMGDQEATAIYDLDVYKIAACFDANFSPRVKNAITDLAIFREDFFFFRDLGLDLHTWSAIQHADAELKRTKFAGDYMTSYQVVDPFTKRRISVTCMYDLAPIIVRHMATSPETPYAGSANNFVLTNAIEGTVNFLPRITPTVNQKALLDDAHINYATYTSNDGRLIVESLYNAYTENSQLKFINNVIAIQEVMRTLRTKCPEHRFKFQNGNDFTVYKEAVDAELLTFRSWFAKLEFTYEEDSIQAEQKKFYAKINFAFNNWVQSESFDLYAIQTNNLD